MDAVADGLIERITQRLTGWHLTTPALAFLYMNTPLSFVGSQALLVAQPLLDALLPRQVTSEWVTLFADRERVAQLIARLESARDNG